MRNSKRRLLKRIRFLINRSIKLLRKRSDRVRKKGAKKPSIREKFGQISAFLATKRFGKRLRRVTNDFVTIQIPPVFSFLEKPDEVIAILRHMYYCGTTTQVKTLWFDHSKCNELGICASTVMDVILLDITKKRRDRGGIFNLGGDMSKSGSVTDILEVSGLPKHLGFPEPEKKHIEKLELQTAKVEEGLVQTRVVEYFLKCLATQGFTLTADGRAKMLEMVGEVINNCKLHSGELQEWFVLGHYSKIPDQNCGECHLTIFNFGNTIYESLLGHSISRNVVETLKRVSSMHAGLFSPYWTEEALWTLYALQDGVSRLKNQENPDRGTGTVRFIEAFQSIGRSSDDKIPAMSITSGRVHIYFDGTYKLKNQAFEGGGRQIIAFNKENNLHKPPDRKYIKILKNSFPGTVISMKFYLDHEYLYERMAKGEQRE